MKVALFLFALVWGQCSGYPDGNNILSACTSMIPNHGAASQTTAAPYSITISVGGSTYSAGETFTILISANSGSNLKGFFVQARAVGSTTPVGRFTSVTNNGKTVTCTNMDDSISHSEAGPKTVVQATWVAPSTNVGTIQFIATIVQSKLVYWVQSVMSPQITSDIIAATCPALTDIANGVKYGSGTSVGVQITYVCNTGFQIATNIQSRTLTCQSNGNWDFSIPTCTAITCPALTDIANAVKYGVGTSVGVQITYVCNTGFQIATNIQSRTLTCLSNGNWDNNVPACTAIASTCPALTDIANAIKYGSGTSVGVQVTYVCNTGFQIATNIQSRTLTCQSNGIWDYSIPTCTAIGVMCPALPNIANGVKSGSGTSVGAQVTYTCNTGFQIATNIQSITLTCQSTGNWNGNTPTCTIIPVSCPNLQTDPNFAVANAQLVSFGGTTVGAVANYQCDNNYQAFSVSDLTRQCLSTGQWSGSPPICQVSLVTCPALPNIADGVKSGSGTSIGSQVTYTCNTGFQLALNTQSMTLTCQSTGNWNGNTPSCTRIVSGGAMTSYCMSLLVFTFVAVFLF